METTGITFVDELGDLAEKRVFIRCDFNVPLDGDGVITDDARIRAAIPTIEAVLEKGALVILASHLGRPKGKPSDAFSMVPVGERLGELLGREIILPEDVHDEYVEKLIEQADPARHVILLENLRFDAGEKKNDEAFGKRLASLADFYVNDAFGTAHRAHASVYGMVEHFGRGKKAAGFLMRSELENLGNLLTKPQKPFVAVMGGAKVSDKLGVLHSLIDRVQTILIGGAMAYTFLKAKGVEVGDSRVEEELVEEAAQILAKAKGKQVDILLPIDHVVVENFEDASGVATPGEAIPIGTMGLDIGPKTRAKWSAKLLMAKTVFWNGPMGVFEREAFAAGTIQIAQALADSPAASIVGGGDSASAVKVAGVLDRITHVSTGGGASLEFVEGGALPGIEALRLNHPFNLG